MATMTIQCLCAEVSLELSGEPIAHVYCHCDDCQTAHSAAYVPIAMYPAEAVRVTRGNPSHWMVKRTPRATCARRSAPR